LALIQVPVHLVVGPVLRYAVDGIEVRSHEMNAERIRHAAAH
jgi:hypothetical protein